MLNTTLNRIYSLSPNSNSWKILLNRLGKKQPDDETLDFLHIQQICGLDFALLCCQSAPEFDKYWRLYAIWCARQVKHSMTIEQSISALNVAERYANGQSSLAELKEAHAAAKIAVEKTLFGATHQSAPNWAAKAAANATELIIGLAVQQAAYSAVMAASCYAGDKADREVSYSSDDMIYQGNRAKAYDDARFAAFDLAYKQHEDEFVRLVTKSS